MHAHIETQENVCTHTHTHTQKRINKWISTREGSEKFSTNTEFSTVVSIHHVQHKSISTDQHGRVPRTSAREHEFK